ncbi:MAG: iron-containing alcohol dehydrogenase [Oscillospiraceae bacterium]|jgi:glycerol-1-phosphate dehydrogenase [NAD(P)+]|nr:iron-containing alcohol dehydrogenase [Oscillospiraceae bacterium]
MWEKYKHIVPFIFVSSGAINTVSDWIKKENYKHILIVCDPITKKIAGDIIVTAFDKNNINYSLCTFKEDEPLPDEKSVGALIAAYTADMDLILGVGAGTINDICTYVGAKVGCPSAIVGTAPSMDGYASLGSAMLFDGVKVTPPTQCPVAIFCDIDILSAAPMNMIAAGLGDMLGKVTSLVDWQLSFIVTGEDKPEDIVDIMQCALEKIIIGAPKVPTRDPQVIQSITEGLILSGIAMSLYGDSRPASGTEHHLAHYWEMRQLKAGIKPALHGTKVGVATIVALVMWHIYATLCQGECLNSFNNEERLSYFYQGAQRLHTECVEIDVEFFEDKNTSNQKERLRAIDKNNSNVLRSLASSLPKPEKIADILSSVDAPIRPSDIGINENLLHDSILYAKDRKPTYTLMQHLNRMNLLEDFAKKVSKYFSQTALKGVKCFVLDMDGTIYLADELFPFTLDFLNHIKKANIDHIFFTNNSSQNTKFYLSKLQKMGINVTPDKFLMSTGVLLDYLSKNLKSNLGHKQINNDCENNKTNVYKTFIAGTQSLKDDFIDAGYILTEDNPDFVVLGFDTDMDYKRLTRLCDFVREGKPIYGVNMDYNCPIKGGFIPDCGSLAAAVYTSTGVMPEFFGKPSRHTLDYIIQKTGYKEEELCFVGDRLYTDIAIATGTKARSVLVLSGEAKREDLENSKFVPDLVVDDLSELIEHLHNI